MAPVVQQFLTAKDGALSVTTSSTTLSTDLLVLTHYDSYGPPSEMTAPSGAWTSVAATTATYGATKSYYKQAAGGAETVTVTQAVNGKYIGLYVIRGGVFDTAVSAANNTFSATQNVPGFSTTSPNSLALLFWGCLSFPTDATNSYAGSLLGDTYRPDAFDNGGISHVDFEESAIATPSTFGPTPNTINISSGTSYHTHAIVIKPTALPGIAGTANLPLAASGTAVPGLAGTANLPLAASGTTRPVLTGEANLPLDAMQAVPMAARAASLNRSNLRSPTLNTPPTPAYRLCVADTKTGKILADLPMANVPTWSQELNAAGSLSGVSVPMYPKLSDDVINYLTTHWHYSLVFAYGDTILQAGMITGSVIDDAQSPPTISLSTTTIWEFYSKKRIASYPGQQITDPASNITFAATSTDTANQNLSWGSVARRLIEISNGYDLRLAMPVNLPTPTSGTATITYAGADLGTPGGRISDMLSQDNPPEVVFDPVWDDSNQSYFSWNMLIADAPGRLGQLGFPHYWDYQMACQNLRLNIDGTNMTFYVFAKGQDNRGSTGGTLTWAFTDVSAPQADNGWPFLWTSDTAHSSETKASILKAYANGIVKTNQNPVYTAAATVRMDGRTVNGELTGSPSVDQVNVGDTCYIQVSDHPFLADGKYGFRVLSITNGQDAWSAVLNLQMLGVPQ